MGRSVNKIDIAVQDDNGKYVLGILCDNEQLGAGSVRDREYGNENVLKRVGWKLTRVYALEWWQNAAAETKRLIGILEEKEPEGEAVSGGAEETESAETAEEAANPESTENTEPLPPANPLPVAEYKTAVLTQNIASEFRSVHNFNAVVDQIRAVIAVEGPLSQARLYKIIAAAWNIPAQTQQFLEHLQTALKRVTPVENMTQSTKFYWNKKEDMAMGHFRAPSDRKSDEIPKEEYAAAVFYLIENGISERGAMAREAGKLFGLAPSPVLSMRVVLAVTHLIVSGKIRKEGDGYRIT